MRLGLPRRLRRRRLPPEMVVALGVNGERVLAWSELAGNGLAAATPQGLRVLAPSGHVVRRPWVEVDHVVWDEDSRTLAVWWVGGAQPTPLEVREQSFLPEIVHERVRSSLVLSREVPLPGDRSVWVALRKDADGNLTTQAASPRGARLDDPDVKLRIAQAESALREEAGL